MIVAKKPDLTTMEGKISAKLRGLGVNNFSIKEPLVGPIVTGYPLALGNFTSVKQIFNKAQDIALACGVESVDIRRIEGQVIIFVPNTEKKIVDFKEALFWMLKNEEVQKMELPIILGTDFEGNNSALDLVNLPHLLIAGSTGSGKSVLESAIIACLAMTKTEKEVQFYIVDPKRVDLTLFEELPNTKKVVETIEDWYKVINYLYNEVQNRNNFLKGAKCRNIREYNESHKNKMAYKILIIDELADLIEKDKYAREEKKQENIAMDLPAKTGLEPTVIDALKKLIQISRAAGIHIICCTQRTSVDVISGTVKANFPARIALRLPQSNDSRTILDENGAENLLGKGDMLLKHPEKDTLQRFHAPFVRMEDINFILEQKEMIKESLGLIG